jgi:D-alanyl-D-alanine carboxypeptidase
MARKSRGILGAIVFLGIAVAPAPEAAAANLLVDAETGAVIAADAPNHLWYPASLTKMMTVYVALGEIKAGRLSFDENITVSKKAASVTPFRFGLAAGQKITVRQAINATIVASANDAAVALAEKIGGTEENFADLMTATAHDIGMTRTMFRNATGLPDGHQVTTARDLALLAMSLLRDYPLDYPLFNQRSVTIGGKSRGTVNGILGAYAGADGIKTGFTCGSGYNLVASAVRGNRRVIGVVLGSTSRQKRLLEMIKLLDAGLEPDMSPNIHLANLLISAEDDGSPPVILSGPKCPTLDEYDGEIAETAESVRGWAIILGSYAERAKAQMALVEARVQLGMIGNAGISTIAAMSQNGIAGYNALIFDLTRSGAASACKKLIAKNFFCTPQGPQIAGIGTLH